MQTTPIRSDEETQSNDAFDALLWALSRPGQVRTLPAAGEAALITALLDRECAASCDDPLLISAIMQTGAAVADITVADHVFLGKPSNAARLREVRLGSDLYPDDGATVVVRAGIGNGQGLRLTGPGVDGALEVRLDGISAEFWQTRKSLIRYPMGFDLFVLDGSRVMGLPRSTNIEVL
jgi:alpha-D-ribose 1-methylphosphonate 5-triphosphate synthase subunit PhnH